MKKIALALILTMGLLFSFAAGMQTLETTRANFIPTVSVKINSPINGTTYESTPLLNVHVNFYAWGVNRSKFVVYSVDNSANLTLTGNFSSIDEILWFTGSTGLPKLSSGKHSIKVYAWVDVEENSGFIDRASSEVIFQVNNQEAYEPTIVPPAILVFSPQNNSATNSISIPLVFNVSAPKAADAVRSQLTHVYYTGDWQTEKQDLYIQNSSSDEHFDFLEVNTTLSSIPEGTHELQIFASGIVNINKAMFGYTYHSDTNVSIVFTVNSMQLTSQESTHLPGLFLTVAAAVAMVTFVAACAGLLLYFRKRLNL